LSSTTDRRGEQGQVIVLFAGAIVTLLILAALAFDVGSMLLERRDQQNAADASALAGARYVLSSANFHSNCGGASGNLAVAAACDMAAANGHDDSRADEDVLVDIPPVDGEFRGLRGFVEVRIRSRHGSVFGGVIGRSTWPVSTTAVAANSQDLTYPFGMLALNPTACKAILISGTGTVNSASNVQSNSDGSETGCGGIGLSRTGGGVLNVSADGICRSGGSIQDRGSGSMTCAQDPYSFALPDPLRDLAAPAKPALAPAMKEWLTGALVPTTPAPANVPKNCPGRTDTWAPSETAARTCVLGLGSDAGRVWVLSPGLYPGGLDVKGGSTLYLLPGIYWIGGGGFQVAGDSSIISVDSETDRARAVCTVGATPPCTGGGGVLIYNSQLPTSPAGPISLGGSGATLSLMPYAYPFGDSTIPLVIFQDRTVNATVTLNGSNSTATDVRGLIYVPAGQVKVNGASSAVTIDQVIADTFMINGSGGTINVLRENGVDAIVSAVGLVE
jgi:hypothetical protein